MKIINSSNGPGMARSNIVFFSSLSENFAFDDADNAVSNGFVAERRRNDLYIINGFFKSPGFDCGFDSIQKYGSASLDTTANNNDFGV